jgi:hypothetical protein
MKTTVKRMKKMPAPWFGTKKLNRYHINDGILRVQYLTKVSNIYC